MLVVNNLISYSQENEEDIIERVLWLDKREDIGVFINVYFNRFPYYKKVSEVENDIESGKTSILSEDPLFRLVDEESIPEENIKIRDEMWAMIEGVVELEPQIYNSTVRRKYVLNISNKYNIHENTVVRYLKRYWKRGKNKNALLPDYYLCGGRGRDRQAGEVKRGRPRKYTDILGDGINVDEEIKKIFKMAVNKYYYNSSQKTLTLTYELMLKEFFNIDTKVKGNVQIPIIKTHGEIPTLSQFRYWFEKERNFKREISTRKSTKKYQQNHRGLLGDSTIEAIGPGYFEIDATVGDIYLVSRYNRNWIIGRPVIYFIIDRFSRMIVGMYIGFEGPSWAGAMMALANCASNKKLFCEEYGIEVEEEDWPIQFLPDILLADRGELEGSNIENLINMFGVKVQNTPPFAAQWKPIIEQNFRVMNLRTKPLMPGVINSDYRERGDRDYRLDAKLDIYQFTQIIIKSVLYHNNQHYLNNYNREEMMIEDDIEPIPIMLWNWGIQNRTGKLKHVSEDIVKLNLMPTGKATVTARGIRFKGMYYGSKESIKDKWFEKARNQGSWSIQVSFDKRNMDYIYIKNSNGLGFEKCFLLEHQIRYKGKRLEEIEYLLEYEKLEKKKNNEKELQHKVDLITEIEHMVNEAKKVTNLESNSNESNNKKKKRIGLNRKIEKTINREHEAFELDKSDEVIESAIINLTPPSQERKIENNELELLRKKQKEALKKIYE